MPQLSATQLLDCDCNKLERVFRKLSGVADARGAYWIEPAEDGME